MMPAVDVKDMDVFKDFIRRLLYKQCCFWRPVLILEDLIKEERLTFGVLEEVTLHPQSFECVFLQDTTSLTARDVVDLFETRGPITAGSNRRRLEVEGMGNTTFLDLNKSIISYYTVVPPCYYFMCILCAGGQAQVTLKDIVIFATGLSKVPAMGFPVKPQLAFLDPEQGPFPRANTCSLTLKIPVGLD